LFLMKCKIKRHCNGTKCAEQWNYRQLPGSCRHFIYAVRCSSAAASIMTAYWQPLMTTKKTLAAEGLF
jgi:hypothetical protein